MARSSRGRYRCPILALISLLLLCVPQWTAQAQDPPARLSLALRGVPLDEALHHLTQAARVDLAYNPDLTRPLRTYCVAESVTPEEALACILDGTGLDFYRLSSGTYVLVPAAETDPLFGRLNGLVVDRDTGAPLPRAHVLLAEAATGHVTNEYGRFSFARLKPGFYHVTTSYVGYHSHVDTVEVPASGVVQARITLTPKPLLIAPIIIDGMQWRQPSDAFGSAVATQDVLLDSPQFGTADVSRSLNALVGVRFNDATADVHVQGGEAGENQFRLDGAPVFVPTHLGNVIGLFSPFAISRVTVHKAGFEAEYGSQISGVINAEHALGSASARMVDLQVDPLSLNGRLRVRTRRAGGDVEASLMAAARLGLWSLSLSPPMQSLLRDWNVTDPFMQAAFTPPASLLEATGDPLRRLMQEATQARAYPSLHFGDVHLAARIQFGLLQSLSASGYWGRRALDGNLLASTSVTDPPLPQHQDAFSWDNGVGQLRYERVLGAQALASLRARASTYRLRHDVSATRLEAAGTATQQSDDGNRIQEVALEARLDYAVDDRLAMEAGLEPTYTSSRFTLQSTHDEPIRHAASGWRLASFVNARRSLGTRTVIDLGSRFTYLGSHRTVYAEPRLSLRYDQPASFIGPWSFRGAVGVYRQFVNQFDVSSRSPRALLSTNRVWLAVDSSVAAPLSLHSAVELLWHPATDWTVRFEVYNKYQPQILVINYAAARDDALAVGDENRPQGSFLADGVGYAYGAGVLVERQFERLRLEGRYEYSHAERGVEAGADQGVLRLHGNYYPVPWDEPHRVELALDWAPSSHLTVLGRWRAIWGRTWAFRQAYYDYFTVYRPNPDEVPAAIQHQIQAHINHYKLLRPIEHRLPPLYQLDLSTAYAFAVGRLLLQARLDLLNVLNAGNVAEWRFVPDADYYAETGYLRKEARALMPFTPSLAIRMQW